jgi:hypothetical protein
VDIKKSIKFNGVLIVKVLDFWKPIANVPSLASTKKSSEKIIHLMRNSV